MTIHKFIPQNIRLDNIQSSVAGLLEIAAASLNKKSYFQKFTDFFKSNQNPEGIYLYGGVGRGKTMLMKSFFERIDIPKEIVHYQNFMQEIHTKLHKLRNKYQGVAIEELASDIASKAEVLCLDEFEIKDITDAMIIKSLFEQLAKRKVFIFLTTNTIPENLYKDGIQRESFLPFIKMIQEKFTVLHLDSNTDYRFMSISEAGKRVLYPINKETEAEIQRVKQKLTGGVSLAAGDIEVFGRRIVFANTKKQILFTDFSELFLRELGYIDYVNICRHFQVVVLEGVREIREEESDIITRFINFIDNAYFYKILLFITLDRAPEDIYKKGKRAEEFRRTISRLNEMNSKEYLITERRDEL
jgi:cell division protein ZapE